MTITTPPAESARLTALRERSAEMEQAARTAWSDANRQANPSRGEYELAAIADKQDALRVEAHALVDRLKQIIAEGRMNNAQAVQVALAYGLGGDNATLGSQSLRASVSHSGALFLPGAEHARNTLMMGTRDETLGTALASDGLHSLYAPDLCREGIPEDLGRMLAVQNGQSISDLYRTPGE